MSNAWIDGLNKVALQQIKDLRGSVLHMLRCNDSHFQGFGECYFSEIMPGAIKAWKRHRKQTQNICVPVGRILMVIYDDRSDSRTKGHIQIFELGRPNDYCSLQIAPMLWYGFSCLSSSPALLANCVNIPHDPTESEKIAFNDEKIPYRWMDATPGRGEYGG